MKRIGLTGGIGTGKSTVARLFTEIGGVPVVDADQIARDLRAPGGAAEALLLKRFKTTDRSILRTLLSNDSQAKKDLEAILHPLIQIGSQAAFERLEQSHPKAPFLLYEASLLIESGRAQDFSGVMVVTAPVSDQLARIMSRDGISKESAQKMIDAQSPDSYRLNHADYRIDNCGSIEDLRLQVRKVLDQIQSA